MLKSSLLQLLAWYQLVAKQLAKTVMLKNLLNSCIVGFKELMIYYRNSIIYTSLCSSIQCQAINWYSDQIYCIALVHIRVQWVDPSGAEAAIFCEYKVNTMAVNALATQGARSSTAMVMTVYDKQVLIILEEELQPHNIVSFTRNETKC